MNPKIEIESYDYCEWYDYPPIRKKCPYLINDNFCKAYDEPLRNGYATDSWSGRDTFYISRCERCKKGEFIC